MRLEGTLDAFSLPDIFQLLSFTKKTGTLHLRREAAEGVVHLRDGEVTGARSDAGRQALARRIVGAGLVDDDALELAVSSVSTTPELGLARALLDLGAVEPAALAALAVDHATDAVFDLMRWPDGEFAFVIDEANPDDVGTAVAVDDIVTEGRRRLDSWSQLVEVVPAPEAVVTLVPSPASDPQLSRDEWALLTAVDGRRSVADLVVLSGRGEYAVVSALAALAARGLVSVGPPDPGVERTARVQGLIATVEKSLGDGSAPTQQPGAAPQADPVWSTPVIPERPEPFTPARRPEHAEEPHPAYARVSGVVAAASHTPSRPTASVGAVHGSAAMQPDESPSSVIERDPSVNKSLLLRLIAGVRGL
ncbi:MAG: DUF4388 domain-containing protein [Actinomycetota bacterium]|nr:DUF4388 domain-containing protein [Actinomycetota bacterium]